MSISTLSIRFRDTTGQKRFCAEAVRTDHTIGEILDRARAPMRLPAALTDGEPILYHGRLDREARHLHSSELVGDALQADDEITVQPEIIAGAQDPAS